MERTRPNSGRRNSEPVTLAYRWKLTQVFLQDTSLHGLQYLAHKQYNGYEKAFWALMFVAGLSVSIFFVAKVYTTWQDNPIVMTVESTNEPVKNINFPVVTLCPTQQILLWKLDLLQEMVAEDFKRLSGGSSLIFRQLLMALQQGLEFDETDPKFGGPLNENLAQLANFFDNASVSFVDAMKYVAPNCNDMVVNCTWKNKENCTKTVKTVLTPMGYCCAFNFLGDVKLRSTAYKGKGFGLRLVVHPFNSDESNGIQGLGHKVLVHDHYTYPYRPSLEMQVGPGEIMNVAVQPELTTSDDGVRSISRGKRDCSFGDEYHLGLKLAQTYDNCILDCFHKHQLRKCTCVQGYIQTFNPKAPVCGLREVTCLQKTLMDVMEDLEDTCQCRPPCEEITYNVKSTLRNMTFLDLMFSPSEFQNNSLQNYALVHVFYKESRFTKYKRSLRYKWEDFIAAAGGLLGVGVGFSLLSAVEVIYFFCYKCWRSGAREQTPARALHTQPPLMTLTIPNENYFSEQIFIRRNSSQPFLTIIPDLNS